MLVRHTRKLATATIVEANASIRSFHYRTLPPPTTASIPGVAEKGPFGTTDGGTVTGSVAPGWEDMRTAFENNFRSNLEAGAQLCVFKDGYPVVDLYGHSSACQSGDGYDGDTLQNIFSSGKNFEAISIMILVDRGLVEYSDKISKHWPAFGANGKHDITIEDLLRHESGLQFFADPDHPDDFKKVRVLREEHVKNTKSGAVERFIEGSASWGHGKRMYHASTRGFVVGGIVRQVTGQTLGEFISREIVEPMNVTDDLNVTAYCGATLETQAMHLYEPMQTCSTSYTMLKDTGNDQHQPADPGHVQSYIIGDNIRR